MQTKLAGLLAVSLLSGAVPAHAIPPPPPPPPVLRDANMTATVKLIEASNGTVTKISELCKVSGKIPVYADDGRKAHANGRKLAGCTMLWKGKSVEVDVLGAKAVARNGTTYATASVGVIPADAVPLCADLCGPQPLADSSAEIRISGKAKSMTFSLNANPVSMLHAKPTVWLEAEVTMID